MKWYQLVDTPAGRGLKVLFKNGESATIGMTLDGKIQIVTTNVAGLEILTGQNSRVATIGPAAQKRKADADGE